MRTRRGSGAVTLRDVAEAAGTTPMTVSNVVNGRTREVGRETFERVMEACARLGYRPHASARRLRTNRRMAIGAVIIDPSPNYLADPLTAALLAGLTDFLGPKSYSLVIHGVAADDIGSVPLLQRIETDAICMLLSGVAEQRRATIARIAELGQPMVLIQDELPDDVLDGCSLTQDDRGGGIELARHLFSGATAPQARHVAMLVPSVEWTAMVEREAGIRSVLSELATPPVFHLVRCGNEGFESTQAAFAAHVAAEGVPDVVVGGNDQMAIAAMKLLVGRGIRIPEDVRVTGFNGFNAWRYVTPELTTVFSPAYALGGEAGAAILHRLETGAFPYRSRALPVRFAQNRSSGS